MIKENKSIKAKLKKNGLELEFEFFSLEYIKKELQKINNLQVREVIVNPPLKPRDSKRFADLRNNEVENKYFAYVKFFDNGENLYGIVGGKTNYITPDISYDIEEEGETRLSRCFLKDNHYEYSNRILVIDHKSCSDADDEAQALFTETYIQRLFNLVNS